MFFPISPPWQVCLVVQSHAFVSVHVLGGVVQRQEFVPLLRRFKMASCPFEACGVFLIPNLIGTYLCGSRNGKKICCRILDCRETGVKVLKVLGRSNSCVKTRSMRTYITILQNCMFHSRWWTASKCAVFWMRANDGLRGLSRLLEAKW